MKAAMTTKRRNKRDSSTSVVRHSFQIVSDVWDDLLECVHVTLSFLHVHVELRVSSNTSSSATISHTVSETFNQRTNWVRFNGVVRSTVELIRKHATAKLNEKITVRVIEDLPSEFLLG